MVTFRRSWKSDGGGMVWNCMHKDWLVSWNSERALHSAKFGVKNPLATFTHTPKPRFVIHYWLSFLKATQKMLPSLSYCWFAFPSGQNIGIFHSKKKKGGREVDVYGCARRSPKMTYIACEVNCMPICQKKLYASMCIRHYTKNTREHFVTDLASLSGFWVLLKTRKHGLQIWPWILRLFSTSSPVLDYPVRTWSRMVVV